MKGIILFGAGSALIVDYEETCSRLGIEIAAEVRNRPGEFYGTGRLVEADRLTPQAKGTPFLCPLFTPRNRYIAVGEALSFGLTPSAPLVDPTSIVPASTSIGTGTYLNASVTVGAQSRLGQHVIVNRSASVGHHADIGDFASLGPGVILAGQVRVGLGALLGTGCMILPKVSVGAHAIVGAGAVVTKDVAARSLVVGNPAAVVKSGLLPVHEALVGSGAC